MKRMRSWWLAAAACAVLAAALLLPQRFLQQKLDRVAETEFSVDGAELDMEEAVTLMERLRLAAVGEFIAQNTGDDAGALTAQTQQWLLDAQSVIPQPIRPYIDLSGEVFAESGWILDTASGTVFSAIRASLHHTPFIDTIILLDAQTGRLLHLEMLFYQESDYLILLQDLPDCLEDAGGWRQQAADYYGLTANASGRRTPLSSSGIPRQSPANWASCWGMPTEMRSPMAFGTALRRGWRSRWARSAVDAASRLW